MQVEASIGDSVTYIYRDYLLVQKRDSLADRFLPGDRFISPVFVRPFLDPKHKDLFDSKKYWNLNGILATLWLQNNKVDYLESSSNWYYTICKL